MADLRAVAEAFRDQVILDLQESGGRLHDSWNEIRPDVEEFVALSTEAALAKGLGEDTTRVDASLASLLASLKARQAHAVAAEANRLIGQRLSTALLTLIRIVI